MLCRGTEGGFASIESELVFRGVVCSVSPSSFVKGVVNDFA